MKTIKQTFQYNIHIFNAHKRAGLHSPPFTIDVNTLEKMFLREHNSSAYKAFFRKKFEAIFIESLRA